jgi:parallel beta-helix repeat protein
MSSFNPLQCPACGYRGNEETCPQCGFPIGRYRDFLSGVPVLADEAWKRELEEQIQRHRALYQQRFAAPIPPGALVVAPDGSGNFRSLEEAVQQARPGAVIYLKAGAHRLKHPLVIDKPLTLIGEGMETTQIVCDGEECVVKFSGNGLFSVSDIAFVHEGARWGDAVQANMGEIRFYRCLFTGGVWDEANQRGGDGLWLYGTARGDVRECVALRNAGMGIRVSGKAQPALEGNTCRENKQTGIAYFGSASGTARNNLCTANELIGIGVSDQAQPALEGNTCRENKRSGIAYFGSAAGVARGNWCAGNGYEGIYVAPTARPVLIANYW